MPVGPEAWFPILVSMPASTARRPIMRYMSAWTDQDYAGISGRVEAWKSPWTPAFGRIKTVSKRDPFERWDLPLSEEQTPHIVEKPKNRRDAMEPKGASRGLHTQEVTGSSPVAPTTTLIDSK
jgi:hypothetical protein